MSVPRHDDAIKELGKTPCPVCGHEDRCKANPAKEVIFCFRSSDQEVNGFRRIKRTAECTTYILKGSAADRNGRATSNNVTSPAPNSGLDQRAAQYAAALTDEFAQKFATELGVSVKSLRDVGAGLCRGCICFPEKDATGIVTAINVRRPGGKKQVGRGQKRGLTIPANLQQLPDPVLVVEGASDVCACLTMGLTAVGRPSNAAGAAMLGILLKDREAIVVGENDQKVDGSWPGREGAIKVVSELTRAWGRGASWTIPAKDVKDVREYLQKHRGVAPDEIGKKLLSELTAAAVIVNVDGDALPNPQSRYHLNDSGFVYHKPTRDGYSEIQLTNFSAGIIAEIIRDDGVEIKRDLEIEACLCNADSTPHRFVIRASRFPGMTWVVEELGPRALVYPGFGITDHARAAIQILSNNNAVRHIYIHPGWREISGKWMYLHSKGAIGAEEPLCSIQVELPPSLAALEFPTPGTGADLRHSIRASIDLLCVGPHRITVPLLGAIYRSGLDRADFTISLFGSTGVFKSELAALAQQHFGAGFSARHLPGSWSSTANSLEALLFFAKDMLLVADDFAPNGNAAEVARYHAAADRVIRGQGNNSGRGRLRADGELRPPKPPRGLLLTTGEEVPRGESLRARQLILEVVAGDVSVEKLTSAQKAGRVGVYAAAMAGFLRWVAGQRENVLQTLRSEVVRLRDADSTAVHRRTPEIIANLMVALDLFFKFAVAMGAIGHDEAEKLRKLSWAALEEQSRLQGDHVSAVDPAIRFIEYIRAAVFGGEAHLINRDGGPPPNYETRGWRNHDRGSSIDRPLPLKDCVGWVDGDDVYLDPTNAYRVAQRMAGSGDGLHVSERTLRKRLAQGGHLASTDKERRKILVRRTLQGVRREVLHFDAEYLLSDGAAQVAQSALGSHGTSTLVNLGPEDGAENPDGSQEPAQGNGPFPPNEPEPGPEGPIGPVREHEVDDSDQRERDAIMSVEAEAEKNAGAGASESLISSGKIVDDPGDEASSRMGST